MLILFKDLRLIRWVFKRWFGRARVATFRDFRDGSVVEGTDEIRAGRKKVKANSSKEETNRLRLPLALYTHGFFFV